MFKNLIDKIGESTLTAFAEAGISPSKSHTASAPLTKDPFSIDESEDCGRSSPKSQFKSGFSSVDLSVPDVLSPRSRRSSTSSVLSDASSVRPGSSFYPLASDLESASELDDSVGYLPSGIEQLREALRKSQQGYHKYKGRYSDLARHYREMERENAKTKKVLSEFQDRALRREAELKEQCLLEQRAKAHLEEILRNDLEEKDHLIATLNTKIQLLKTQEDESKDTSRLTHDMNTLPKRDANPVEPNHQVQELVTALDVALEEISALKGQGTEFEVLQMQMECLQNQLQEKDEQIRKLTQLIEENNATQNRTLVDYCNSKEQLKDLDSSDCSNLQKNLTRMLQQSLPGNENNCSNNFQTSGSTVSIKELPQTQNRTQYINALNFDSKLDIDSLKLSVDSLTVNKDLPSVVDKTWPTCDDQSGSDISHAIKDLEADMDNIIATLKTKLVQADQEELEETWKCWKVKHWKEKALSKELLEEGREEIRKLKSLLPTTINESVHSLIVNSSDSQKVCESSIPLSSEACKDASTSSDKTACRCRLLHNLYTTFDANLSFEPEILDQRYKYCVWLQQKFETLHNEKRKFDSEELESVGSDRDRLLEKVSKLEEQMLSKNKLEHILTTNSGLEQELEDLNNRNRQLGEDLAKANMAHGMLLDSIEKVKASNKVLDEDLCQEQNENKSFGDSLEKIKNANKLLSHEINVATSHSNDLQKEIELVIRLTDVLIKEYDTGIVDKEELSNDVQEGSKDICDLAKKLEIIRNKNQVLNDETMAVQNMDLLLNNVDEEKKVSDFLKEELVLLKTAIEVMKEKINHLQTTNTLLNSEFDSEQKINAELKEQLQEIQKSNEVMKEDVKELQKISISLSSDIDKEKIVKTELGKEMQEIQTNNELLKQAVENMQATKISLHSELNQGSEMNSHLREELQELQNVCETLREDFENVQKSKFTLFSKIDEEKILSVHLQKELQELQNSNSVLKGDLENMQTMKTSLIQELEEEKKVNEHLTNELLEVQKNNGLIKEDVADIQTMKLSLFNELDNEKKISSQLKEELQGMQNSNRLLEEEVKKLDTEKSSISSELDDKKKVSILLKEEVQKLQSSNEILIEEFRKLQAEHASVCTELGEERKCSNQIKEDFQNVQKNSELLKEETDQLKTEKSLLSKELSDEKNAVCLLREDLQEMHKTNDFLKDEITKIKTAKATMSNELNDEKLVSNKLRVELQDVQDKYKVLKEDIVNLETLKVSLSIALEDERKVNSHLEEQFNNLDQSNRLLLEDFRKMEDLKDSLCRDLNEEKNLSSHLKQELHQMTMNIELLKEDLEKFQESKLESEKSVEICSDLMESKVHVYESTNQSNTSDMLHVQSVENDNRNMKEQIEELTVKAEALETELQEHIEMHTLQIKDLTQQFEEHLNKLTSEHEIEMSALRDDDATNLGNLKSQLKFYKAAAVKSEKALQEEREHFEEIIKENETSSNQFQQQMLEAKEKHEIEMREVMTKWRQHSNKEIELLKTSHQEEVNALMHEWQCERKSHEDNDASPSASNKSREGHDTSPSASDTELENTNRVAVAAVESSTNTLEMLRRELVSQKTEIEDLKKHGSDGSTYCTVEGSQQDFTKEYLRNVLYEFLMGSASHNVLVKVLADLVQFDPEQTRNVLEKFEQKRSLLNQLGLL